MYVGRPTLHPGILLFMRGLSVWCRLCRVKPTPPLKKKRGNKNVVGVNNPTQPTHPTPGSAS